MLTILRNRPGSQPFFSVFSRPGITFAEILRAGTETRPYKKQLRPMSGGPSCFYYEVKATICCAPVRTAIRSARRPVSVPQIEASRFRPLKGKHISRYLREFGARRRVPEPHNKSRYRAERIKIKSRYLRDSGNPRRGFPTPKQSPGLFRLPSCAFARKRISLRARSDQRFHLWIPPPLKRRAKFYFRADSLQMTCLFHPTESFSYPYNRNSAKLLSGQASKEIIARPARICSAAARAAIHRALARACDPKLK